MLGRTVSHYRIVERLGEGGMGEVFLAQDLDLERPVALKMLRPCADGEEDSHATLLAEARIASALNHPAIAVVYEVDEVEIDGTPVGLLAMEYVAGEPIDLYAQRHTLDLDGILTLVRQAAEGLAAAHERGIVHRDVKPSNLFVTHDGRVKILDFGLAERTPEPLDEASTWSDVSVGETVAGTVAYMAPEQALGRDVDPRADLFALGVVFYELVAGRSPFRGATSFETAGAILFRQPAPLGLAAIDPRGGAVERLVFRLLEREREARPASAAEVAAEIDALLRQGRRALPSTLAAGVVVAGFENLTGDAEDDWIGAGLAETIVSDLARLEGLRVVAQDRVAEARRRLEQAAGGPIAPARLEMQLGRTLDARWVISGAVQRLGETVRSTIRLTDAASGEAVDSWKLDGTTERIFDLQDRAVAALARRLAVQAPARALPGAETAVVAAYEALSKGLLNLRTETFEGMARSTIFFERAVALDPAYARAHLELGVTLTDQADYLAMPELYERALAALSNAIRLAPEWARTHRELGAVLVALGRVDEGVAQLERALELAPDEASVLAGLGRANFLGRGDFATAATYYERAVAANPHAGWYWLQLAHVRTLRRDLGGAREAALRAIELQEKFLSGREGAQIVGAHMRLGHVAAIEKNPQEAAHHFQEELGFLARVDHALRSRIVVELHMRLGGARLALAKADEARANFAAGLAAYERRLALGADEPFTRYYAAAIHALAGEDERAISELERAAAVRPRFTIERARIEPEFERLADHPRFRALVAG
ncbi:MAG: protein kinase [Thermoanaerobaculia bacterium]